jgi:hypothetical protein
LHLDGNALTGAVLTKLWLLANLDVLALSSNKNLTIGQGAGITLQSFWHNPVAILSKSLQIWT